MYPEPISPMRTGFMTGAPFTAGSVGADIVQNQATGCTRSLAPKGRHKRAWGNAPGGRRRPRSPRDGVAGVPGALPQALLCRPFGAPNHHGWHRLSLDPTLG